MHGLSAENKVCLIGIYFGRSSAAFGGGGFFCGILNLIYNSEQVRSTDEFTGRSLIFGGIYDR